MACNGLNGWKVESCLPAESTVAVGYLDVTYSVIFKLLIRLTNIEKVTNKVIHRLIFKDKLSLLWLLAMGDQLSKQVSSVPRKAHKAVGTGCHFQIFDSRASKFSWFQLDLKLATTKLGIGLGR